MRALAQMVKEKSAAARIGWALVLIGGLAATAVHLYALNDTGQHGRGRKFRVERIERRRLVFPAVTVCSLTPMKRSAIVGSRLEGLIPGS